MSVAFFIYFFGQVRKRLYEVKEEPIEKQQQIAMHD